MKIQRVTIVIAAVVIAGFFMPTAALAHGHWSIGIGIGVPVYGGYGYWGGPCYYPYYPYRSRVVFVAPAPVVAAPVAAAPVVVRIPAPSVAVVSEEAITSYVNVQNSNGSITPVRIRRLGNVWVGPRGEQYFAYPTVEQLKPVYGF